MQQNNEQFRDHIARQQAILEDTRQQLKKEFIGIDAVIDSVIDSITAWYLFPEIQERPLVVNLWGMTGVGKTALVLRLVALLNFEKKLFRFDMGNDISESGSIKDRLKKVFRNNNGKPLVLMLDEFQYARTKNEESHEISNPFSRVIWDLLDSGRFETPSPTEEDMEMFRTVRNRLAVCLDNGIKVERGVVQGKEEEFIDLVTCGNDDEYDFEDAESRHKIERNNEKRLSFLPVKMVGQMFRYNDERIMTLRMFRILVYNMNGEETLGLLDRVIERGTAQKPVDCSKALVFILGNLDDAYRMSGGMNPDMSADDFHEESLRINIGHIKKALKKRFKPEQIARLGNNHIIYPSFSTKSFEALIELELKKVTATYLDKFNIGLKFTEAFRHLVYREGVYPTQGTRPLFSTVYQMVNTKISMLLSEKILHAPGADSILFDFNAGDIVYTFLTGKRHVYFLSMPALLNLEKLRAPEKDDLQAITAVHEAGHAIVSMSLSGILPDYICSTTADAEAGGFVILKNRCSYLSRAMAINLLATSLGGLLAESLVFGEDRVTAGAEQDIERATDLAAAMVKDYGMGSQLAKIDSPGYANRNSLLDKKHEANEEVQALLQEGKLRAEEALLREKQLLLNLADHLSDQRMMDKEQVLEKIALHGSAELKAVEFVKDHRCLYYREHLKRQVQRQAPPAPTRTPKSFFTNGKPLSALGIGENISRRDDRLP